MLNALGDSGQKVDWWFMYKVSNKALSSTGKKNGDEYVYFDSEQAKKKDAKLTLSDRTVQKRAGALFNTLNQLRNGSDESGLGWYFYNDQPPGYLDSRGKQGSVGDRGHTKGVLAFDMKTNSAFWLVQSTPAFPAAGPYAFPNTGLVNGQTYLCITLADLKTAGLMAKLMYWAQGPNVYAHSQLPKALSVDESVKLSPDFPTKPADMKDHAIGYLAHLMNNSVDTMAKEFAQRIPFRSKASPKSGGFMVIAKNKTWGKDFYNDLVGPTLHENIDVETWEHDPTPGPTDSDHVHRVTAMKSVNLAPLGIPISWSEEQDHAKLAISDKTESNHWICVGDINFTIAQEKRGGGTVAFRCEPLWKSLSEILSTEAEPKAKAARASKS